MSKTEITAEQLDAAMCYLEGTTYYPNVVGVFGWSRLAEAMGLPADPFTARWDIFDALVTAGRLERFSEPGTYGHTQYRIVRAGK